MSTMKPDIFAVDDLANRLIIVRVEEIRILELFNAQRHDNLLVPWFPDLPRGYEVYRVHHNYMSRAFDFVLRHPEFSPVPPGGEIPVRVSTVVCDNVGFVRVPVDDDNDGGVVIIRNGTVINGSAWKEKTTNRPFPVK